jgi:hypothetical protein
MSTIKEQFQSAVKNAIGGDKNHGWGVEDSMEVIDTLIAENCEAIAKDKGLSEELSATIKAVINPSAFRQILESKGVLSENKTKRKESATKSLLDGII